MTHSLSTILISATRVRGQRSVISRRARAGYRFARAHAHGTGGDVCHASVRGAPPPGAARAARPAVSRGRAKISSVRRGVVAAASKRDDQPEDWQLKYLYDGGCTVCNSLVKLLKSKKGHEKIWCVHAPTTRGPRPGSGVTNVHSSCSFFAILKAEGARRQARGARLPAYRVAARLPASRVPPTTPRVDTAARTSSDYPRDPPRPPPPPRSPLDVFFFPSCFFFTTKQVRGHRGSQVRRREERGHHVRGGDGDDPRDQVQRRGGGDGHGGAHGAVRDHRHGLAVQARQAAGALGCRRDRV